MWIMEKRELFLCRLLLLLSVPWAYLLACKEKFRITCSRIDQPRGIPVHTKVRESIFKLGRNVIDLLSREGWFNTVGKLFFNSKERCLLCKRLGKSSCRSFWVHHA